VGEAKTERRVALRHQRDAPNDVEQLLARKLELVLELLGQELAVVRELSVDAPRRQPRTLGPEDDVVLVQTELHLVDARGETRELLQRPCGDDRLELRYTARRWGLLDGETVGVGCRHHELVALEAYEDPAQHGTALVAQCR